MRPTPCSTAKMYDGVSRGPSSTGHPVLATREHSLSLAVPGERRSSRSSQTCFTSSASVVSYRGWGAAPPSSRGPIPGFLPSISGLSLCPQLTPTGERDSGNCPVARRAPLLRKSCHHHRDSGSSVKEGLSTLNFERGERDAGNSTGTVWRKTEHKGGCSI